MHASGQCQRVIRVSKHAVFHDASHIVYTFSGRILRFRRKWHQPTFLRVCI